MMDEEDDKKLVSLTSRPLESLLHSKSEHDLIEGTKVEIELLIPGLCTMEVRIPKKCTIPTLKEYLVRHANENLLRHDYHPAKIAKAWLILAMFGIETKRLSFLSDEFTINEGAINRINTNEGPSVPC